MNKGIILIFIIAFVYIFFIWDWQTKNQKMGIPDTIYPRRLGVRPRVNYPKQNTIRPTNSIVLKGDQANV